MNPNQILWEIEKMLDDYDIELQTTYWDTRIKKIKWWINTLRILKERILNY